MPSVGDRVVIDGTKVGQQRREGDLLAIVGRMIRVRWSDGTESLMTPAPGSVTFERGSGRSQKGNGARAAAKPAAKSKAPAKAAAAGAKSKTPAKKKAKKR